MFESLEALFDKLDKKRRTKKVTIGNIKAKLYLPPMKGTYPAVLFNQGLMSSAELGIANFFPRYLTALGIAVLIPVYEGHEEGMIKIEDAENVVEAFEFLRDHEEVDPKAVGMFGLSYGGLLSLIGATDPRISEDLLYVVSIAGPSDLVELLCYAQTSDEVTSNGPEITDRSLKNFITERVDEERENESLTKKPSYRDFYLYHKILGLSDADEIAELLDEMSPLGMEFFEILSPLDRADQLNTRVLFVHGEDDRLVPYDQSVKMHEALLAGGKDSELIGIPGLGHIIIPRNFTKLLTYARSDGESMLNHIKDFILR